MRNTGFVAVVCGICACGTSRTLQSRNECSRQAIERDHRCQKEGHSWLVGPTALSAGTLEERLVLIPSATAPRHARLSRRYRHALALGPGFTKEGVELWLAIDLIALLAAIVVIEWLL